MPDNRQLEATWKYHNDTKHSLQSVRNNRHSLDWDNQPLPFKIYATLDPISLPTDRPAVTMPALSAISAGSPESQDERVPDMSTLATLLFLSGGITKRRTYPGGEIAFRAAACTGALYHIDLYLVCSDLPELPAGVYHFGPHDFALRRVRAGDYRRVLAQASGQNAAVTRAPATMICTSTYWRNAWKYQARTYRHCFWDSGTLLANFLAAATVLDMPARLVSGFVDRTVNHLLDLDTEREVALVLVPIGDGAKTIPDTAPALEALDLPTKPLSKTEVDYPAIRTMHAASSLTEEQQVKDWRGNTPTIAEPAPSGRLFPLKPLSDAQLPDRSLERVIHSRGSARSFTHEPVSFSQLSTLLVRSTGGVPADFLDPYGATMIDLYLIVNAVEDLPSGSYVLHRNRGALELLQEGNFRRLAGYLGLGQQLPADAGVNIYCLAHLPPILERFGNRGYRAAQLEGAVIGGRIYLAAYSQGLGATGLTFFDDDVTAFFAPHAADKSVMFLTAVGKKG